MQTSTAFARRALLARAPTAAKALFSTTGSAPAKIIYTKCDEAPMLATYAFLPVIRRFTEPCGVGESWCCPFLYRICIGFPSDFVRFCQILHRAPARFLVAFAAARARSACAAVLVAARPFIVASRRLPRCLSRLSSWAGRPWAFVVGPLSYPFLSAVLPLVVFCSRRVALLCILADR